MTEAVEREMIGKPYNDGLVASLQDRILADYRDAGYQEAALTGVRTTFASTTPARVEVDLAATLHTGEPYRVSKITWAGSPQMSPGSFAVVAKLHAGGLASQQGLYDTLETLSAAYRNQGYVDVVLDAGAKLDTTAHQVSYTVTATPGPQYKLRDLKVAGLTAVQRQEFDSAWKLHPGDIYNAGYVKSFLLNNPALPNLRTMTARFNVSQEPESGVLDLTITFRPNAGL
jgi:outer membrane protein insertion porin family